MEPVPPTAEIPPSAGFFVNNANKLIADQVIAELAFHDARAEALVHELAASRLPSLQILANTLRGPLARLAGAAADAEFDELAHSMLLAVVVIGLHQVEHLVIRARPLAKSLAILTRFQLDDPDAFARRPTVLLHHAGLESNGLLKSCTEFLCAVVGHGVLQTNGEGGDLNKRILGPHELHHVWRGPHLDAQLPHATHAVVELALIAAISLDLARIAPDNERIKTLGDIEKLIMLVMDVLDQLATHASVDHAICDRNRVVAVAIR